MTTVLIPEVIREGCYWALCRPDLAPPITGLGFIELWHCFFSPDFPLDFPWWMKDEDGGLFFKKYKGKGVIHIWADQLIMAAKSVSCHVKPTATGFIIVGTTRLTEPYVRRGRGVYAGLNDSDQPLPTHPNAGYTCHAPIALPDGFDTKSVGLIDHVFESIEENPPHIPVALIAAALKTVKYDLTETAENIKRFCASLSFVDPSYYHGDARLYPGFDSNFYPSWFEGLCAIKSLPWKRATKEAIAIWWSKRTDNHAGDDEVVRKLNWDIRERAGGITYRSIFRFARLRGWDG